MIFYTIHAKLNFNQIYQFMIPASFHSVFSIILFCRHFWKLYNKLLNIYL